MQIIKFPLSKQPTWTYIFVLNCLGRERWLVHVGKCKRLPARRPWSAWSSATPSQGEFPQRWWWRFGPFSCHLRCNRSFPCHVLGLHATNWEIGQPGFQHSYIWVHFEEDLVLFWFDPAVPVGGNCQERPLFDSCSVKLNTSARKNKKTATRW